MLHHRIALLALAVSLTPTPVLAAKCAQNLEKQDRYWILRASAAVEALIPSRGLVSMVTPPALLAWAGADPVTTNLLAVGWLFTYHKLTTRGGMAVTGRNVWNYLLMLRLSNYPFQNKKILDLGSGRSFFGSVINRIYGDTGTQVINLDLAHGVQKGSQSVTADMRELPFAPRTFDLVVSNWAATYLEKEITRVVSEALRVLRPGGTIKIRLLRRGLPAEELYEDLITQLRDDERVSAFSFDRGWPDPLTYLLTIVAKDER